MPTTPTTNDQSVESPQPTNTGTYLPHPLLVPLKGTNTTCLTPTTCYLHHHRCPQHQRWGLGTNLSSLRSHIHLKHLPGWSLANPSHRDWRTSAWSTNTQQRPPPPTPFTNRTVPLGHRCIHEIRIHCDADNTYQSPPMSTNTSSTSTTPQAQHLLTYLVLIVTAHAHHASTWSVI
ncbi:unnamed protein product [Schistocephalus solidus]|uniref:Uncharacterized protein n=1 Tax=Schistocephalus solidus TaxID=70667 RepID=A0A183TUA5_SCHSO|nr:unnamed protein product [Schistocephalus solidus]